MLSSAQSLPSSSIRLQFSKSKSIAGKPLSSPNVVRFRRPLAVSPACATASAETASSSFYDVLGISVGATGDEIKAAYRRLARSCHPDVAASGRERKSAAADEFMRVHAAYSTLSDPEKRADYDRRLSPRIRLPLTMNQFGKGLSASPASSSSSFYRFPRRSWETDQCW